MQKKIPTFFAILVGATLTCLSQNTINGANTMQNQGDTVNQKSVPSNSVGQAGMGMTNGMLPTTNLVTRGTNDLAPGENTNRWNGTNDWPATNGYNPTNFWNSSTNAVPRKHWWQKIF